MKNITINEGKVNKDGRNTMPTSSRPSNPSIGHMHKLIKKTNNLTLKWCGGGCLIQERKGQLPCDDSYEGKLDGKKVEFVINSTKEIHCRLPAKIVITLKRKTK